MTTYKEAGVDIDAANEGLKRIKKYASTLYPWGIVEFAIGTCKMFPSLGAGYFLFSLAFPV